MKSSKRAERRHHNARLLKNRYNREVRNHYWYYNDDRAEVLAGCLRRARLRLDTNVLCSCAMCGNPRRTYGWNTWGVLTFQEMRSYDAMQDGLEEYFEEGVDNEAANQ